MNTFRHSEPASAPAQDTDLQQKASVTDTDRAADAPATVTNATAAGSFSPIREAMHDPLGYIGTHCYALWLLYLPVYLLYFGMLQMRVVPAETVHIIETPLDRMIPTIPAFFRKSPGVIAYFSIKYHLSLPDDFPFPMAFRSAASKSCRVQEI